METIFFSIASVTARTYWPIALCAIFFERSRIFGALIALFPGFRGNKNEMNSPISETKKNPVASFIMAPYAAVARIHCLILVLGFLIIFYKNDSLLIFALSYILLFFPYKKFFEWITGKEDKK